jgi:hypothetical protein
MITFLIAGSKHPKRYRPTKSESGQKKGKPNVWNCTCKGWAWRNKCRHQRAAEEALMAGVLSMEIGND